jgi:hypothetical protein
MNCHRYLLFRILSRSRTDACERNDRDFRSLVDMSNIEIAKPLSRAINIYRRVARRDLDLRTRREVARHMKGLAAQGVEDPGQLTVHGLSHLRRLQRRTDAQ